MLPSVYMETSVLSDLTARPARDIVTAAHQQLTAQWWETRRTQFEIYVSEVVLREAELGDPAAARDRLTLAANLPRLVLTDDARALQERLLTSAGLPARAALDALHVAVAAVHRMEYLVTWNVRHIANAETRRRVEAVCRAEGYRPPVLCTPEELLGDVDDPEEEIR